MVCLPHWELKEKVAELRSDFFCEQTINKLNKGGG